MEKLYLKIDNESHTDSFNNKFVTEKQLNLESLDKKQNQSPTH
jgi:hypothetical protein